MRFPTHALPASIAMAAALAPAFAQDAPLSLEPAPSLSFAQPQTPPDANPAPTPVRYGLKGQDHLGIVGGYAHNFSDASDFKLSVHWSRFIADDIEFGVELSGWFFDQEGDNAFGLSPALLFRWHFVNEDRYSIYLEPAIGPLFATDNVPDGGTSFDFMPRIGFGATYALDDGARLIGAVHWHHISNARINGDARNPSRDGVGIYAGVIFPY